MKIISKILGGVILLQASLMASAQPSINELRTKIGSYLAALPVEGDPATSGVGQANRLDLYYAITGHARARIAARFHDAFERTKTALDASEKQMQALRAPIAALEAERDALNAQIRAWEEENADAIEQARTDVMGKNRAIYQQTERDAPGINGYEPFRDLRNQYNIFNSRGGMAGSWSSSAVSPEEDEIRRIHDELGIQEESIWGPAGRAVKHFDVGGGRDDDKRYVRKAR